LEKAFKQNRLVKPQSKFMFLSSTSPPPLLSSLLSQMSTNERITVTSDFNIYEDPNYEYIIFERFPLSRRIVGYQAAVPSVQPVVPTTITPARPVLNSVKPFPFVDFLLNSTITPTDFTCAICLDEENGTEIVLHPKKCHHFHRSCLTEWMQTKQDCPLCRRPYDFYFV
jgi:hypothetical protein